MSTLSLSGTPLAPLPHDESTPPRATPPSTKRGSFSGRRIAAVPIQTSNQPRLTRNVRKSEGSDHQISKVTSYRDSRSGTNSSQKSSSSSTEAVSEAISEAIAVTYSPDPCTEKDLEKLTFNEYQKFSSDSDFGNDSLFLFEEGKVVLLSSTDLAPSGTDTSPEERKIVEGNNKVTAANNKLFKDHFATVIRTEFGNRIADYFLLSEVHQSYLKSDAPLTVGIIRTVFQKAEAARTFVEDYCKAHPEFPKEIAPVMGHAAFLEKEAAQAYQELEKMGLPKDILEEVRAHNVEFLQAAGVNTAIVAGASTAMLAGLTIAFHAVPARLITTVPASIAVAIGRAASSSVSSNDSIPAVVLTRTIPISIIAPVQALFLHALYNYSPLALPLGIASIVFAATNHALQPGHYVVSTLRDSSTPLSQSAAAAARLVQSKAILEETAVIQQAAISTYQEAARLVEELPADQISKEQTEKKLSEETLVLHSNQSPSVLESITAAVTTSWQRLLGLDKQRLKELPYSPYLDPRGNFRPPKI